MSLKIYRSQWCAACHTEVPKIKAAASKAGLSVETIDIDRCDVRNKDVCDRIEFVPTAILNGREVTLEQLKAMAK